MSNEQLHEKILGFLGGEMKRKEGRQCVKLELLHANPGYRGDSLRSWTHADDPDLFDDLSKIEDFVSSVIKIAEGEADSYGKGKHRFVLISQQLLGGESKCSFMVEAAFRGDDANGDTFALSIPSGGDDGGQSDVKVAGVIPAILQVLGMQMRHNETHMRNQSHIFQGSLNALARVNEQQAQENRELRTERSQLNKDLEAARTLEDERTLKAMSQQASDQRKEAVLAKILPLTSIVASRLLGAQAGGGPDGAGQSKGLAILIDELRKSLTPDQLKKVAGALHPSQQMLLAEAIRVSAETMPKPDEKKNDAKKDEPKAG